MLTVAPQLREDPILGERAAAELREAASAHVSEHWCDEFPYEDIADCAQSAYETLLTKYQEGEEIAHPKAYIKRIAFCLARKRATRANPNLVDPAALAAEAVGESAAPGEEIAWRSDIANIAALVDQLSDEQQAVYRAVFVEHLTVRATASRIGRSKSTVDRIMRELHEHFEGILSASGEDGAKVRVLTAYAFGDKSVRRAAEMLLRSDPTAPAILRGIRGSHEGVAALVPPVLVESSGDPSVLQRLADGFGSLRDRFGGSDHSGVAEAAGQLGSSGAGRGSGAAVGGTLATITGALGAKGVALCGAGATAVCVGALVAPGLGPSDERSQGGPEPAQAAAADVDRRPPEPPRVPTTELRPPAQAGQGSGASGQAPSGGAGGGGSGGKRGDADVAAPAPRSAPTPANPSSPSDPDAYNPYSPTSPAPAVPAPAPAPTSGSDGGSSGGGSSGGCNPYDPAC